MHILFSQNELNYQRSFDIQRPTKYLKWLLEIEECSSSPINKDLTSQNSHPLMHVLEKGKKKGLIKSDSIQIFTSINLLGKQDLTAPP